MDTFALFLKACRCWVLRDVGMLWASCWWLCAASFSTALSASRHTGHASPNSSENAECSCLNWRRTVILPVQTWWLGSSTET